MRPVDSLVPVSPQAETSSALVKGVGQFAEVVNMAPTEEGTLRSIQGPKDLIARTYAPYSSGSPLAYGTVYSIGCAVLGRGRRYVILIHEDNQIKVFEGWNRAWKTLIGSDAGAQIAESVPEPRPGGRGARFVATANGVIITAPNSRAYFYDGSVVGYLGYSSAPSAPKAGGPTDSSPDGKATFDGTVMGIPGVNDLDYASDGLIGWNHSNHRSFLGGRLGTVSQAGDVPYAGDATTLDDAGAGVKGYLLPGSYRAYTQFIDRWGNFSPLSPPSDEVTFSQQLAKHRKVDKGSSFWARVDLVRKRVLWRSIPKGPRGTVGRLVGRTKDSRNTGDTKPYLLPGNAAPVVGTYATLCDNEVTLYPDNIPDVWLTTQLVDYDPVPAFTEADVAFGRLWIADIEDDPAAIMISIPGRWGTFPKNGRRYPDPKGSAVVAVRAVPQGVLAFTRTGTFLYRSNDQGDEFVSVAISTTRGCVAPGSIETLPNGLTIWLGVDGFYGFDGESVVPLWRNTHDYLATQHNLAALPLASAVVDKTSGEYRCWVAVKGSLLPDRCYTTTDGRNWRWRTEVVARGACSLPDDDQLTLVAGQNVYGTEGVWVVDRGDVQVESYMDTGWLSIGSDRERASVVTLHVRLRETRREEATPITRYRPASASDSRVKLEVSRDYRGEVTQTEYKPTYAPTAAGPQPAFWGLTPTEDAVVRRARPFWVTFDVDVRSAEAVRFKLSCPVEWEVLDVSFGGQRDTSGKRSF